MGITITTELENFAAIYDVNRRPRRILRTTIFGHEVAVTNDAVDFNDLAIHMSISSRGSKVEEASGTIRRAKRSVPFHIRKRVF